MIPVTFTGISSGISPHDWGKEIHGLSLIPDCSFVVRILDEQNFVYTVGLQLIIRGNYKRCIVAIQTSGTTSSKCQLIDFLPSSCRNYRTALFHHLFLYISTLKLKNLVSIIPIVAIEQIDIKYCTFLVITVTLPFLMGLQSMLQTFNTGKKHE